MAIGTGLPATSPTTQRPLKFSIIVPVYNRAGIVGRSIESCLAQSGVDFEVIVVDDGSTDETSDTVLSYGDRRLRLLRHQQNMGVCPARATAIATATGDWCVWLDSDFTMLPGALARLARRCDAAPEDVGNLASVCRWDCRPDSPDPLPAAELTLDYPGYLRFYAGLRRTEYFNVIRRRVLADVPLPKGRAHEMSFHLALAKRYRFRITTEPSVIIHTDARNRITAAPPADFAAACLAAANDQANDADDILREHGEAMRLLAPSMYASMVGLAMSHHLLAGRRRQGLQRFAAGLPASARSPFVLAQLLLGVVSPWALANAKGQWQYQKYVRPRFREAGGAWGARAKSSILARTIRATPDRG